MARIRSIKPSFWSDEKLAPLPPIDRLVFLGLIGMADDAGRLVDNVKAIDGFIFPESEESSRDSLDTLARLVRIWRYTSSSGQKLIQIVNWEKHQKVDNPGKTLLPPPNFAEVMAALAESELGPGLSDFVESVRQSREALSRPKRESPPADVGYRKKDGGSRRLDVGSRRTTSTTPQPQGRAHAREEFPDAEEPAAAAAAEEFVPSHTPAAFDLEPDEEIAEDVEKLDAIDEMQEFIGGKLEELMAEGYDRTALKRVTAKWNSLINGDDYTAWADHEGSQIPWPQRPRLLRLTWDRWEADQKIEPRSHLRYVVPTQLDPHPTPAAKIKAGSEAAKQFGVNEDDAEKRAGFSRPKVEAPPNPREQQQKRESEALTWYLNDCPPPVRQQLAAKVEKYFEDNRGEWHGAPEAIRKAKERTLLVEAIEAYRREAA